MNVQNCRYILGINFENLKIFEASNKLFVLSFLFQSSMNKIQTLFPGLKEK